jgi:hypothetical protein
MVVLKCEVRVREGYMTLSGSLLRRPIAAGLVLLLATPLAVAVPTPQQQATGGQQPQIALLTPAETEGQPQGSDSLDPAGQAGSSQSSPGSQQTPPAKPVGTAAAPLESTTGITASRPAGAVIAPAKQRRARVILIRIGVIVGAAIAVGAVVGLSEESSSRPPK